MEWPEVLAETDRLGEGPRCRFGLPCSIVSCPRSDTLFSEEDRSGGARLFEKSRRKVSPTLEARLGRVSSFCVWGNFESRTIPENGTADNLSFVGEDLNADRFVGLRPSGTFGLDSILGWSIIALELLGRARDPKYLFEI